MRSAEHACAHIILGVIHGREGAVTCAGSGGCVEDHIGQIGDAAGEVGLNRGSGIAVGVRHGEGAAACRNCCGGVHSHICHGDDDIASHGVGSVIGIGKGVADAVITHGAG